MSFTLEQANLDDAESIAEVMLAISVDDGEDTGLTPEALTQQFIERVRGAIQTEGHLYLLARQAQDRSVVVGHAHWIRPGERPLADESLETKVEATANPSGAPLSTQNAQQLRDNFLHTVMDMQNEHFKDKKYWILAELSTHPSHRQQGVASTLVNWGTTQAHRDNLPTCLVARTGNTKAMNLYAKLGFEVYRRLDIDMPGPGGKAVEQEFVGLVMES